MAQPCTQPLTLPLAISSLPPSSYWASLLCLQVSYWSVHKAISSAFFNVLEPSLTWITLFPAHSPPFSSLIGSNHSPHTDTSVFQEGDQKRRTGFFIVSPKSQFQSTSKWSISLMIYDILTYIGLLREKKKKTTEVIKNQSRNKHCYSNSL